MHKNKSNNYYDLNTILNRKFLDLEEDKCIAKKRMKIIENVEKSNKSSNFFNSYNEEVKNYFLKNYVIDKITQSTEVTLNQCTPTTPSFETGDDYKSECFKITVN